MRSSPSRTLSPWSFLKLALSAGVALAGVPPSCPNDSPLSCQTSGAAANTCCLNSPGGQLLLTQFWDADPATGPVDSWTVHGLWPDKCDGTFDAYCDSSRQYADIDGPLRAAGRSDLVEYMNVYWKDYRGDDESLWKHEWDKHGTCISTLEPSCYSGYTRYEEMVDYFEKAVELFRGLNTYQALARANIRPSANKTYTSAEIQRALARLHGGSQVTLGCKSGQLNEVWYHFNVRGSLQSGDFIPSDPDGPKSTCPRSGIKYLPKRG